MRYLKSFKSFKENAAASASSTSGMGAVSSAQPGALAGTTGTTGSGDISFYMLDKKGKKIKKGDPTQVTDLRYLEPAKGITKLKESNHTSRDPRQNSEISNMIDDCIVDLNDLDFELMMMDYQKQRHSIDLDDEETGYFEQEELRISLYKTITKKWTGNITINCKFDELGITHKNISTLRAQGDNLDETEQEIFDLVVEVALKLIGTLEYQSGNFSISFLVAGSAMPTNSERNINTNISFSLYNDLKI
jgi:hypothetical protein